MSMYRHIRPLVAFLLLGFIKSAQLQAGLIAYWTGDNTAADSSGNGHNGALFNGTTFESGVNGQAFSFDGNNDYVQIPGNVALQPATISVSMWVKAAPGSGLRLLADSSHGGTLSGANQGGWALQLLANERLNFAYGNGLTFPNLSTSAVVADNTFHHVVTVLDGSQIRLYVDGALDNTGVYSGSPVASTANGGAIRLGNHYQFPRPLNGLLDEVRIYDHALSLNEVTVLSGNAAVPEPSSFAVLGGSAFAVLVAFRRKRKRAHGRRADRSAIDRSG